MTRSSTAVVFESPGSLSLREVGLPDCGPKDCLVEVFWSGISTGTERLLWDGRMPPFPGLAYPLVPGYESVGRVIAAGASSVVREGTLVFVPGSRGFVNVEGLFGGAARHLVVDSKRLTELTEEAGEHGTLLALIATAVHALSRFPDYQLPELVIGNGVLGRLVSRIALLRGAESVRVWEKDPRRSQAAPRIRVVDPATDTQRYHSICDVSGDAGILDMALPHLERNGTVVLAGFYHEPVQFQFPSAFMCEADIRVAAEWRPEDLRCANEMLSTTHLQLSDLITHRYPANEAEPAYTRAFSDPDCLKLILDWRSL